MLPPETQKSIAELSKNIEEVFAEALDKVVAMPCDLDEPARIGTIAAILCKTGIMAAARGGVPQDLITRALMDAIRQTYAN